MSCYITDEAARAHVGDAEPRPNGANGARAPAAEARNQVKGPTRVLNVMFTSETFFSIPVCLLSSLFYVPIQTRQQPLVQGHVVGDEMSEAKTAAQHPPT